MVEEEEAVLIALVRGHRRAVGAAVRWAVDDEVPGAVEEEAGPAAVRRDFFLPMAQTTQSKPGISLS